MESHCNELFDSILKKFAIEASKVDIPLLSTTEQLIHHICNDAVLKQNVESPETASDNFGLFPEILFYHYFHIDDYEPVNKQDLKELFEVSINLLNKLAASLMNTGVKGNRLILNIEYRLIMKRMPLSVPD